MEHTNILQKTMLVLPESAASALQIEDTEKRDKYLAELRAAGWTLQSIANAAGLTRERVRQIIRKGPDLSTPSGLIVPPVPEAKPKRVPSPRVIVEPEPETLAQLLALQPDAQKVRANGSAYRKEAEQYTKLLDQATRVEGVTPYHLAQLLGISHGAIRFRLARYGYIKPKSGTSKVYQTIKQENRVDSDE